MEIYEIKSVFRVAVVLGCILLATSCGEEKVKKSEFDALLNEFNEYREATDAANQLGVQHQATLNQALEDLSKVSGMTMSLRGDIENRRAKVSQSNQIKSHILAIEKRMDALEKEAVQNEVLKKSIAQMRVIIKEKQQEIAELHRRIEQQGRIIDTLQVVNRQRQQTIEVQKKALASSRDIIAKQHAQLLDNLYNAAHDIELLAVQAPKMTRSKNKKLMKEYQVKVCHLALKYYQIAADMGHSPSKRKVKSVNIYLKKLQDD